MAAFCAGRFAGDIVLVVDPVRVADPVSVGWSIDPPCVMLLGCAADGVLDGRLV